MRKLVLGIIAVAAIVMTTGCETIKGAGRDITNAGEALEDAVR